ncbi:sigma 54-interacting transcriptional regulator [Cupriavidus sp. YAF13]|uniref:sigma-54 dependent transcriptional regulator n=1 Tax=Cupriavidus sp. YAF13 TaxID=3233075 RepID=UPI003F937273
MTAYVNRPLLYLSQHHDAMRCRFLAQQGWKLIFASSQRELDALAQDTQPISGLLDIHSGFSDAELESFEPWLAQPNMSWVATVTSKEALSDSARRLLGLHFVDYYRDPCDMSALAHSLGHAVGMVQLRLEASHPPPQASGLDGMIGNCAAMQSLFRGIEKVSRWDTPVLIAGESGTGKELAAQAIHRASRRAGQPFVAVNCAAIPPTLLMSELFGYERGAFTGALKRKPGRIEMAHGGTLFLDEIGDMPLESQASLLRFLETGRIERLGSTESITVDARIVSATHVDLDAAVAAERFRGDLYHRLCVLRVKQPPLREREGDITLLAEHILNNIRSHSPDHIKGFSPAALRALSAHDWPGNVRELINRTRHAAAMCENGVITPCDLDLQPPPETRPLTLAEVREAAELNAVKEALQRHHERLIDVAAELGISRVTLFRMMREHRLQVRKGGLGMVCLQG